jgi:predicted metallo-beta-lactamase superfamily hydrolase
VKSVQSPKALFPVALTRLIVTHTLARSIDWPSSLNTLPVMRPGAVGSIKTWALAREVTSNPINAKKIREHIAQDLQTGGSKFNPN